MSESPLVDLAQAALSAIVNSWAALQTSYTPEVLLDLPDRQYVNVGIPAADCEQCTVSVERTFGTQGSPAQEQIIPIGQGVPWLRTMVIAVQILRCATGPSSGAAGEVKLPPPLTLDVESKAVLADADAVLDALIAAQAAGELAGCGALALENWRAITAQGGLVGGLTKVRLNLF